MSRYSFLLIFLLALVLPARNQEPALPFAYVISNREVEQNVFVRDARSGDILYAFGTEEFFCPTSISDDGQWFVYSYFGRTNYVMELATGVSQALEEGFIQYVAWSGRYNLAAYHLVENPINRGWGINHIRSKSDFTAPKERSLIKLKSTIKFQAYKANKI